MIACLAAADGGGNGNGNGNGGGSASGGGSSGSSVSNTDSGQPVFVVHTPGFSDPHQATNSQILLQRVRFSDANVGPSGGTVEVLADRLIYPSAVSGLTYSGHANAFRVTNGSLAPWSVHPFFQSIVHDNRTQLFMEQAGTIVGAGGNALQCGSEDYQPFAQAILGCLRNNNLNYRVGLENAPPVVQFSYVIEFESRVWDSHFLPDTRQELLFFEEQGNSIMTVQAMEGDALVGNEVVLRSVSLVDVRNALKVNSTSPSEVPTPITSQAGRVKLGKVRPDGTIDNQGTWAKFYAMDLNELGVAHLKKIRVKSSANSGGGNRSAHVKVMAVDTSPAYTAQTMNFD